jgi:hypothetical protein
MFQLPATIAVFLGCVLSAATSPPAGRLLAANDKRTWQETELEKFLGRWTMVREERTDKGKIRRKFVELEFADGNLKVLIYDEKDGSRWKGSLKVMGVEQLETGSRLILGNGERKTEVYYDFVGGRLILVGKIGPRPWEGFRLSGEYKRAMCW